MSKPTSKKIKMVKKKLSPLLLGTLVILVPALIFGLLKPRKASAAWFDYAWGLRKPITITNNGSAQENWPVQVLVDTATLIAAGDMQADCDDARFAASDASILTYYLEADCDSSQTVFWVEIPSIAAGTSEIYFYYDNSAATSSSTYIYPDSSINYGNGTDGDITISADTNINTANSISGRSCADGGDAVNYTVTENRAAATNQIVLSSTPSAGCLAVDDEVLIINLMGTSGNVADVGEWETAKITNISTATLTLSRDLTNGYDGTTQKIMVQRIPNYDDVTTSTAGTDFTASAFDGTKGGVMMFRARGTVTVAASTTINTNALGYRGGTAGSGGAIGGTNGESYDGVVGSGGSGSSAGTSGGGDSAGNNGTPPLAGVRGGGGGGGSSGTSSSTNNGAAGGGGGYGFGGGGGGGAGDNTGNSGAGGTAASGSVNGGGGGAGRTGNGNGGPGGNAGSAGSNASGTGGPVGSGTTSGSGGGGSSNTGGGGGGGGGGGSYGSATLATILFGSGGGGGGDSVVSGVATDGGDGGGIVYISASTVTVSGNIQSNGETVTGATANAGNGGSGAGGSIFINSATATLGTTLVTASGGTVATGGGDVAGGGAGGDGIVYVAHSTTTGTTTPTATTVALPAATAVGTEQDHSDEPAPDEALVASWNLNEGYGAAAADATGNGFTGTLSGSTLPAWQPTDMCKKDKCLYFDGATSRVTMTGNMNYIKTLSFWVKPNDVADIALIDINGTAGVTVSAGTISATGFTSPTIYVDGIVSSTLVENKWQYVTITTDTPVSGWAFKIGNYSSTYLQGFIDDVKVYNYVRTPTEISIDLQGGAVVLGQDGSSAVSDGLLGYWKLNESSGNAVDSSGNGLTLTNNATTTYVNAKYGRGSEHVPASSQYLSTATTINDVKSVSFWANPDNTTNYFISLTASVYITASSGTLSATGFTNPTIYVDGVASSTIAADTWQYITVTSETAVNADTFYLGRQGSNYYDGTLDDVRIYNKALTPVEVAIIKNAFPGPVAHYSLDENTGTTSTNDVSGNGNHLTLTNTTTSSWASGKFGSAIDFEADSDQHATIADNTSLSITSDLTLAAWIKPESVTAATNFGIVSKNDTGGTSYAMSQYGDEIRVYIGSLSNYETTDATNLAVDTWYHVEAVYRASTQTVEIYVNGVIQDSTTSGTIPSSIADDTDDFSVGSIIDLTTTTLSYQVDTSSEDGDMDQGGDTNASLILNTMPIGSYFGNAHMGAAYFSGVNIAQGTTVTSARFTATGAISYDCISCTLSAIVSLEDTDDSTALTTANMNDKTPTTATTTWNIVNIDAGVDYQTDVTSAVQEVLDRGGWASGNDMTVLIRDNGSDGSEWQDFCTYDSDGEGGGLHADCINGAKAPILEIEYQTLGYVYYDGVIDDVRVYNYTRTVGGIIEDMNGGHPLGGSPISSKVIQYNFDEQQGTTTNNSNSAQTSITGSISGATWLRRDNCKYNGCLDFDATDDVVTVTNTAAIDFDTGLNTGFTFSAWINPDSDGESDQGQIFYKGTNTWCRTDSESGGFVDIECSVDMATDATVNVSTAVPINSWSHFAIGFTDDADDEITVYINGIAAGASVNGVGPLASDTNDLLIGGTTTNIFDGSIDDLKLYSSELTAAQILIDMNSNAAANFGTGTTEDNTLTDGALTNLLAWWKLDENTGTSASDFSGNGNTGTLDNGPTWEKGKYGSSVQFSTTNDSINMGNVLDLANTDFTISLWLYRTATPVDSVLIANKTTAIGSDAGFSIFQWAPGNDGVICFYIGDGTDAYETCTAAATAETLNTWEHIVVVFDRTGTAGTTIYQNGVDAEFAGYEIGDPTTIDSIASSDIFCVGARPNSVTDCNNGTPLSFLGRIDDIQIYGEALTPAQVAYLYNRGKPMGWWKLDECTGTTAYDSGAGANNGTIVPGAGTHTSAGTCNSASASEMWDDGQTGKRNYSLDFDGTDDYVDMNDTAEFDFDDKDFTVMGWFNRETYTTDNTIIAKKNDQASSSAGFVVWIDDSTDDLRLVVSDGDSTNLHTVNSTTSFTATGWQHFAITYDDSSASGTQIYINGVSDSATNSTTGTFASIGDMSNAVDLRIGAESDGGNPFAGELDDIRIYNYALSETQVKRALNDDAAIRFGPAEGAP